MKNAFKQVFGEPLGVSVKRAPVLRAAIQLRNPYVDPLSLIQISLLRRQQHTSNEGERALIEAALGITVNGVVQGMRNTG